MSDGALLETGPALLDECSVLFSLTATDVVVEARGGYTLFTGTGVRNLWTGARASRGGSNINAYTGSGRMPNPDTSTLQAFSLADGNPVPSNLSAAPVPAILENELHRIVTTVAGSSLTCTWDASVQAGGTDTRLAGPGEGVVVGTLRGQARFEYVVAYLLGP